MALSTAISTSALSRVLGYAIKKGDFSTSTRYLPQRIAILGEANTANQSGLDTTANQVLTATAAAEAYGYGSPIHNVMRILRPAQGGGVGVVPTVVYAQAEAGSAVAAARSITVTGTATATATHYVKINGRTGIDGQLYAVDVIKDETASEVAAKINTAINGVLYAPASSTVSSAVATVTAKWKGVTSEELTVAMFTDGVSAGLSYAVASTATGSGQPSVTSSLALFGNDWNTIVINPYTASSILDELETTNGNPSVSSPSGRFLADVFKPFVALFGNTDTTLSAVTAITDGRKAELTNVLCPAPGSEGFTWEAAANVAALFGPKMNDTPHLDISGEYYADMPTATTVGDFGTYTGRDAIAKVGCSTVDLDNKKYKVQELITTYHPDGEEPAQYRYPRDLMIDFNVKFGLRLLELTHVVDHAVAADSDTVSVAKVVKPKMWQAVVDSYADDLSNRALIVEPSFMQDSIQVATGSSNPNRLETTFKYKRSPYVRIVSTTVEAGFAFNLTA